MNGNEWLNDALIAHGMVNCVVSLLIARNQGLSPRQKFGQILVVWLVPIFGSLLIGIFLWTQSRSAPPLAIHPSLIAVQQEWERRLTRAPSLRRRGHE